MERVDTEMIRTIFWILEKGELKVILLFLYWVFGCLSSLEDSELCHLLIEEIRDVTLFSFK